MSNRNNMIPIPGRLHSVAVGEPVSGADEVLDDALNMEQSEINQLTVGTKNASTGTTGAYPYNGMGRVVLPKNMVNGVNTLTQDMLYKGDPGSRVPNTNTIFVIQYDFVLGEDITVPAGCILEFDGGSIANKSGNNYTITCNGTEFKGTPKLLVNIGGTVANYEIKLSWFDSVPSRMYGITLSNHKFTFDTDCSISQAINVTGNNIVFDGCFNTITSNGYAFINLGDCRNIEICNFIYHGTTDSSSCFIGGTSASSKEYVNIHDNVINTCRLGIHISSDISGESHHCSVWNNKIFMNNNSEEIGCYAISIANCNYSNFYGNYINGSKRHAFYHAWGHHNNIYANTFENNGSISHYYGVLSIARTSRNINVENNKFTNNAGNHIHIYQSASEESRSEYDYLEHINIVGNQFTNINYAYKTNITIGSLDNDNPLIFGERNINIAANIFRNKDSDIYGSIVIATGINVSLSNNSFYFDNPTSTSFFNHTKLMYIGYYADQENLIDNISVTNNIIYCFKYYSDNYIYYIRNFTELKNIVIKDNHYINEEAQICDYSNGLSNCSYVYDLKRNKGIFANAPILNNNYIGYEYFATDKGTAGVGAVIYFTGNNTTPWVYADGTAVS